VQVADLVGQPTGAGLRQQTKRTAAVRSAIFLTGATGGRGGSFGVGDDARYAYPQDVQQRDVRVGDVERGAVVRRLERALRDGRITVVEFDERAAAAWASRTRAELDELVADLPQDLW
jgi:hypothetical protein